VSEPKSARLATILELSLARFRLYYREPGAMFWTFGFPVVISIVLGIAFRNRPPEPAFVAVAAPELAPMERAEHAFQILKQSSDVDVKRMSGPEADAALRTGKVSVVVVPTPDGYDYRFDPTRPESRIARFVADDVLQRGEGRKDAFSPQEKKVTEPGSRYIDFLVPGLVGLGLMSTGLWGVGFSLSEMRTKKLLKRLMATPMKRPDFLASFLLVRVVFLFLEMPTLLVFARFAFDVRVSGSIAVVSLVTLVGGVTFAMLGLLIASRAENPQIVSGLINIASFPMYLCSGIFFSSSRFPESLQPIIRMLPLTLLIDALRAVMIEGAPLSAVAMKIVWLAAWGIGAFVLALRLFKWR
jgi:ABC transporter DrrB family efflux protein